MTQPKVSPSPELTAFLRELIDAPKHVAECGPDCLCRVIRKALKTHDPDSNTKSAKA